MRLQTSSFLGWAVGVALYVPALGAEQPNIVLIVADDLGYPDICAYGCTSGRTPNIDSLAERGVRFTDGYVSAPICSPSRAGMLTGRYQQRFGHEFNAGGQARSHRMGLGTPASETLLPAHLKAAGYATGMSGKWHLGSIDALHPLNRGFDEFFGFLHGANAYFDSKSRTDAVFANAKGLRGRGPINPILRGHEPVDETEYLTDALTREAVSFIERHAHDPFFLYVPYNAPHTPLEVTRHYYDRFPEIEDHATRVYKAMISAVDDGVGAIISTLEANGIADDTLVIFTADTVVRSTPEPARTRRCSTASCCPSKAASGCRSSRPGRMDYPLDARSTRRSVHWTSCPRQSTWRACRSRTWPGSASMG